MALSWSQLSADQKVVYLLEGLVKNRVDDEPMACRVCDQIFIGNKSLVKHCRSHFIPDGPLKPGLHVRSFASSKNDENISSNASHLGRSLPVAAGIGGYSPNGFFKVSARQSVSQNPPNLSLSDNYVVPTLLRNSVQLRGPNLFRRPQPYPSPSIFHSTINRGTSSSLPKHSSNFSSGLGPQPTLPPNFHSPVSPVAPGTWSSRSTRLSNCELLMSTVAYASPHIQQSNFRSPINAGASASASDSVTGTNIRALDPAARSLMRPAMRDAVNVCSGYTKPYILQLELSKKKIMVVHNDEGDNINPGGVDLDLKL